MKIVGIDFSINYPASCITDNTYSSFKWVACINTPISGKYRRYLEDLGSEYPTMKFLFVDGKEKKSDVYHITERNKLDNQILLSRTLVSEVARTINNSPALVVLEGLSFGSPGNSLIDLAHATGIVKSVLFKDLVMEDEKLVYVFSPSELKNAIGCKGNANKIDVFNKFLTDPILASARESDLFRFISQNRDEVFNGKVVKSPFMDMIDSYLAVLKIRNLLSSQ